MQRLNSLLTKIHQRASRLTAIVRSWLVRHHLQQFRAAKQQAQQKLQGRAVRIRDLRRLQEGAQQDQQNRADLLSHRLPGGVAGDYSANFLLAAATTAVTGGWTPQDRADAALRAVGTYSADHYLACPKMAELVLTPHTVDLLRYRDILPTPATILKLKTPVRVVALPLAITQTLTPEALQTVTAMRSRYINANWV